MLKYDKFSSLPLGSHHRFVDMVESGTRVLDIGCATGYTCERLVAKGCEVVGIEVDKNAARLARTRCSKVIVGSIESEHTLQQLGGQKFHTIILGDVLEHLANPRIVLEKLQQFLFPGGFLLVSLPNVAHWRVRLNLLLGKFDYTRTGVMDETHLRFFTLKTARELIEKSGYRIDFFDVVVNRVPWWLAYKFPTVLALKFLFQIRPDLDKRESI